MIQYARSDDKFYKNLDGNVELTDAENLLRQHNYRDAIAPLEKFLELSKKHQIVYDGSYGGSYNSILHIKKKTQRLRPLFILAQLYEIQGNNARAAEYYKEVLKHHPSYEMEFYAKIRRAGLGRKAGSQSDEIKKLLTQMSRDGKYRDFLDQIYYQLGQIVLAENNRADARKYFRKSIASSSSNLDQKAESYLAIGRMDFEEEYYVTAKYYYDSTMSTMAKTDTAYPGVESRDKTLDKLVTQIDIIYTQDSLQRIAGMSDADRRKFLRKLITAKEREEELKSSGGPSGSTATNTDFVKAAGSVPIPTATANAGDEQALAFYFYNTVARGAGYNEFVRKWGRRKLEENWRRKDKSAVISDNAAETDTSKGKASKDSVATGPVSSDEEKLLAGLPMTPEKIDKSNEKLVEAYYALGTAYKDDLASYRKASNALEEMNKRFPKNKLQLESYYQLYLIAQRTKNTQKEAYYKDLILNGYPNSTIAKYIKDPEYLAGLKKKENALSYYYESAFNDYATGMYASAEKKISEVDLEFKENKMKAKFDLLNALVLSKENRLDDYVLELNRIIKRYPKTPEGDQAQAWLADLNHSKLPQIDISKLPKPVADTASRPVMPVAQFKGDTVAGGWGVEKPIPVLPAPSKADTAKTAPKTAADTAKKNSAAIASATDVASAKPYKPLTKSERLDSLIKAEKAERNKPTQTIISKPTTPPAAKDTPRSVKPAPNVSPKDSIAAAKLDAKNKPAGKDTVKAGKPAAKASVKDSLAALKLTATKDSMSKKLSATKDSLMKKRQAFVKDSITKRQVVVKDSITKKLSATKDSLAKKLAASKTKTVAKDTVGKKADPKAKPAAKDTVAKAAPKPAAPIADARPVFDTDTLTEVYGKSDGAPHYVLIYFLVPTAYSTAVVTKLEALNTASFEADKLSAKSVVLDKDNKLIFVKGLKNKDAAAAYLATLSAKLGEVMGTIKPEQYFLGSISTLNYTTLLNTKKINNYRRFYSMNYK